MQLFTPQSLEFQRKILEKAGLGDQTSVPPGARQLPRSTAPLAIPHHRTVCTTHLPPSKRLQCVMLGILQMLQHPRWLLPIWPEEH